jgi:hypothetical protein
MPAFRFDESKTFDANWSAFMAELQTIDAEMAGILAVNKDKLATIVRQGQRDGGARSKFNAEIAKALDALIAQSQTATGRP